MLNENLRNILLNCLPSAGKKYLYQLPKAACTTFSYTLKIAYHNYTFSMYVGSIIASGPSEEYLLRS